MTTLRTQRGGVPPKQIDGAETCANGHRWTNETTRWRWRDRSGRPGHGYAGWERDCLLCKKIARWREGSGLRSQSWLPGATK